MKTLFSRFIAWVVSRLSTQKTSFLFVIPSETEGTPFGAKRRMEVPLGGSVPAFGSRKQIPPLSLRNDKMEHISRLSTQKTSVSSPLSLRGSTSFAKGGFRTSRLNDISSSPVSLVSSLRASPVKLGNYHSLSSVSSSVKLSSCKHSSSSGIRNGSFIIRNGIGFTLVELMIVIAIIGVLAASLFPMMSGYMAKARDTALMTQVKKMSSGLELYFNDNGKYFVSTDQSINMNSGALAQALIPYYIETLPKGLLYDKHRYYSPNGDFYAMLIYTETMYNDKSGPEPNACTTGVRYGKPLVYGHNSWGNASAGFMPICTFQ